MRKDSRKQKKKEKHAKVNIVEAKKALTKCILNEYVYNISASIAHCGWNEYVWLLSS